MNKNQCYADENGIAYVLKNTGVSVSDSIGVLMLEFHKKDGSIENYVDLKDLILAYTRIYLNDLEKQKIKTILLDIISSI